MKKISFGKPDIRTVMILTRVFTLLACVAALTAATLFISRTMNRISTAASGTGPIHVENIDRALLDSLLAAQTAKQAPVDLPARITDPFIAPLEPTPPPTATPVVVPVPVPSETAPQPSPSITP